MKLEPAACEPLPTDLKTLREIGAVVAEASGAIKVVLFGSVARGEATQDSDLDLLLVFDDNFFGERPSLFEMTEPAGRARDALWDRGYRFAKDLVPMRTGPFERGESVIALEARREGIVLYDAPPVGEESGG